MVVRLQVDAADPNSSVAHLLRMAKIIATKLDLADALTWIDRELDGYFEVPTEELPAYRKLRGELKAYNPYHGWQAVLFKDDGEPISPVFYEAPLGSPIGAIEADVNTRERTSMTFALTPERKAIIVSTLEYPADVALFLGSSALVTVVEAVRNLVLDWALKLEKAGVLGEGMVFSKKDREQAAPVTHQFFIQNAGVVGDVSDNASVTNKQTAFLEIRANDVVDFVAQVRPLLANLPHDVADRLRPVVDNLEAEGNKSAPDQAKTRELLSSARTIAEGAAGNLVASGIISTISGLLGAG